MQINGLNDLSFMNPRDLFGQGGLGRTRLSYLTDGFELPSVDPESDEDHNSQDCEIRNDEISVTRCDKDVEDCPHLRTLQRFIAEYDQNHGKDVTLCLDSYLHLIADHDNQFDVIYTKLGGYCDIQRCQALRRNHRNRQTNIPSHSLYGTNVTEEVVNRQILDKIHCYFRHSYDKGYRLTAEEQASLAAIDHKQQDDDTDMLQKSRLSKHNQLLLRKHQNFLSLIGSDETVSRSMSDKFQTCFDEEKCDENELNDTSTTRYSSGFAFGYGHAPGNRKSERRNVGKKHCDFKTELLNCGYITIEQYDHEYAKAMKHFASDFWSRNPRYHSYTVQTYGGNEEKKTAMTVSHVLALMVYCNYTALSAAFSCTYRKLSAAETEKAVLERHSQHYWFGRLLKEAVHYFGTELRHDQTPVDSWFYHGVTQVMPFVHIMSSDRSEKAEFFGPLSTTTSKAVAVHFATSDGMVVKFGLDTTASGTYFDCAWLSDFPSEAEQLFIQNSAPLFFENIVEVQTGTEFRLIFHALRYINREVTAALHNSERTMPAHDELLFVVVKKIMANQLSKRPEFENSDLQHAEWPSLHPYAQKLIDVYFASQTKIGVEYKLLRKERKERPPIQSIEWPWWELDVLSCLFPNAQCVEYRVEDFEKNTLADVLSYTLKSLEKNLHPGKIGELNFVCVGKKCYDYPTQIEWALSEYRWKFMEILSLVNEPTNDDSECSLSINVDCVDPNKIKKERGGPAADTLDIQKKFEIYDAKIESMAVEIKQLKSELSQLAEKDKIYQWFVQVVKYPEYYHLFREHGLDRFDIIKQTSKSDLANIGITKVGHCIWIHACIQKL